MLSLILENKKIKKFTLLTLIFIACILLINFSRGATLAFLITIITGLLIKINNTKINNLNLTRNIIYIVSFFIIFNFIASNFLDFESSRLGYRLIGAETFEDESRKQIYLTAWNAILGSNFMGTGAGSEANTLYEYGANIYSSHNLIIEVLVQYGIIITFLFLIFILFIISLLIYKKPYFSKYIGYSFALSFTPLFIVASGYLLTPSFWMLLACLYIIGTQSRISLTTAT